jgi:hypothetical protein
LPFKCNLQRYTEEVEADAKVLKVGLCTLNSFDP